MNQQTMEMLVDKWMNEPAFRDKLRSDPHATIKEMGIDLSTEDWQSLSQIDWSLSDEELQTRISKGG